MKNAPIVGGILAALLVLLVLVVGQRVLERVAAPPAGSSPPGPASPSSPASPAGAPRAAAAEVPRELLYGRVTARDGTTYEGRLRWGGNQEAFWSDSFNGFKKENPWAAHVPPERLTERDPIEVFGVEIVQRERRVDLGRPFLVRFGDLVRIESGGGDGGIAGEVEGTVYPDVRVTLKSGTVFVLDRLAAGDFDDGVRVWDARHGVVDLAPRQIRSIELLPAPRSGAVSGRLHGTVRTQQGERFTGFLRWNREEGVGTDQLEGQTAEGGVGLPFETVRSIERRSRDSSRVTLLDGRRLVLSATPEVGQGNRGVFVDDRRYGRVLISWEVFDRVDFHPGGSGPAYDDFPPGHRITGSVTTRDGRRLAGRLVYDLDESETTETLDAPSRGVDYTLPFGRIAAIVLPEGEGGEATVTLHSGEELGMERTGDLGEGNAGVLVFAEGGRHPVHVPWADVQRIDFDRPPATWPPIGDG